MAFSLNKTDITQQNCDSILIASGTVFSKVIVWMINFSKDKNEFIKDENNLTLSGHKGVIFSVHFYSNNTLNEFLKYYENKEFKELPMESKKLQKFYVKLYIEGNKNDINITELKKIFKEETGKELILDNYLIGRIKCSINASLKGKEFYEICSIISKKNDNIKAKFFDIRYNINLNQIGIYIQIQNYVKKK